MSDLPTGTVTFLFTDIEGSTRLAQEYPEEIPALLARHHEILNKSFQAQNGYVFQILGDGFCAAFHSANDALNAALEAQQTLQNELWSPAPVKVRMGIHTGAAQLTDDDQYSGYATMASTQRIMSAGHGGQVLISGTTRELVRNTLPANAELLDLGEKRLKDLLCPEHLYQLNIEGLPTAFPPLRILDKFQTNLPNRLTSFIGREKEIEQVMKRLGKYRLVTITGSGGVGKTRLSIQVASKLLDEYPDGVWLVELAPITDPDLVTQTVCATLDVAPRDNTPALTVLKDFLIQKKVLLVIDNCEHLIDASAQLCEELLYTCPNLCIIASSREALGIDGENAYHVPSLSLPDPNWGLAAIRESDAVKLFIERATAVLSEFELTESNASSVVQICKRLDGIPLAIELAASRLKILKVEQIAARLDDAFSLLTGGSRTALPRQQTLRALIDWSYNLLSEEERIVLRGLSVFMGGWTLEAAESVCGNSNMLDLLTHLVDKSLVSVDLERGDEPRYFLLETIRQYAREKLVENGEGGMVRNLHMEYFCQLVERIEPNLRGPDQVALLDGLERELDNLRAALEWALDHDVSAGLRLVSELRWFWQLRSHLNDAIRWLDKFLSVDANSHALRTIPDSDVFYRAKALLALAFFAFVLGEYPKAMANVSESLALCEKMDGEDCIILKAEGYQFLGANVLASDDIDQAASLAEKSLELYQSCGDKFGIVEVQSNLQLVIALRSADFETARILTESSLAIREELGDKDGIAYGLTQKGLVAMAQDDYELAQKFYSAAVEASREARNDFMLGWSQLILGIVYLLGGKMHLARECFLQTTKLTVVRRYSLLKRYIIYCLVAYSFEQKYFRKFVQLNSFLEKEKNLNDPFLFWLPSNVQTNFQKKVTTARAELDQESLNRAEADGKAMTLEQALVYALEGVDG